LAKKVVLKRGIKNGPVILMPGDYDTIMNDQEVFQKSWTKEITL